MNHIEWGEGPWNNEEDHYVWVDEATDLDCMIHRGPSGALCGYVGVGPDHPAWGEPYQDVDVEVHGGLTYANPCQEGGEICHVPAPGREHDIWWFGFDCCHFLDFGPRMEKDMEDLSARMVAEGRAPLYLGPPVWPKVYRDVDYVRAEVASLAAQLKEMTDDVSAA